MTAKIRLQERFFATSWPENMSAKNSAAKKFSPHCGLQTCLPLAGNFLAFEYENHVIGGSYKFEPFNLDY